MPPHQTFTAFLCVALLGCAAGVEEERDPLIDPLVGASMLEAGVSPPIGNPGPTGLYPVTPPTIVTTDVRVEVVVVDAGTFGFGTLDASGSGQGATTKDTAVGQASNPQPTDAGSATADTGSVASDASTGPTASSDAATAPKPVDAGYTPPEAGPMCQVATCTNYCGLARRCCNASNQCACMSLFGSCTLPSLRP